MFTNKSKIMNAGDYPSYVNIPDLVRQQLIQFFAYSTRPNLNKALDLVEACHPCFQYSKLGRITSKYRQHCLANVENEMGCHTTIR